MKLKIIQMEDFNNNFFNPIKIENINLYKNEIINMLKTSEQINRHLINYESILEEYFYRYKNFNESFPFYHSLRENNFNILQQSVSLINYMEDQTNLERMYKCPNPYVDYSKNYEIKNILNKRLDDLEQNAWWYKYEHIDSFEIENIVQEIDTKYNFPSISDLLNKKNSK